MKNDLSTIEINGDSYVVVQSFPVLHSGWECDEIGYLVISDKNKHRIIMTNHGRYYVASTKEVEAKVEEYRNAISLSVEALQHVYGQKEAK
jgi:hypothetical protein